MLKKTLISFVAASMLAGTAFADRLADVKSAGVLKAGVKYDFKPFGFVNDKNKVVGFDIDLLKYIAKDLGVKVKFQQVTSKTRIPLVAAGQIDIAAASMTHKVMRDDTIDFTISYFFDGQSMLVRKDCKKEVQKDLLVKKLVLFKVLQVVTISKMLYQKQKLLNFKNIHRQLWHYTKRKLMLSLQI